MKIFIIKCVTVTVCLITLISFVPVQKYDFPDKDTRCNKLTGQVEYYSNYFGRWNNQG